jgi:hypothetical protein
MKLAKVLAGLVLAAGLTAGGAASAQVITASGSGWIDSFGDVNNGPFADGNTNTFTGVEGGDFNNWFKFDVPGAVVTGAVLSIWNDGANTTIDPGAEYSVHAPSDFSFAGLAAGVSFGSVLLGVADTGVSHYVDIVLNGAGLAYINSHLGGPVDFGGTVASLANGSGCFDCVAAFGYTGGFPDATLTLTTGAAPEPASWALTIAGFGLLGAAVRRRRAVALAV